MALDQIFAPERSNFDVVRKSTSKMHRIADPPGPSKPRMCTHSGHTHRDIPKRVQKGGGVLWNFRTGQCGMLRISLE